LRLDDVAHDLELEGARRPALDRQLDRRVLRPAHPLASAVDGQAIEGDAVGGQHEVARAQPGLLGR